MAIRILLAVAVLGLLVSECVWGQANAPEPAISRIFNGKDLTGWKGNDRYWSVKDGAIVGHSDKNVARNEFIWSDVEVQDFYLAVDVKLIPGDRNAGIQFRSKPVDTHGQAHGYQADVGHDQVIGNVWGNLYHEHGRGKLDWNDRAVQVLKNGDWNRYEILAVGHRIWTAINGRLCVAIEDPEGELSGKIAFQLHGGPPQTVHYRNPTLTHNPKIELAGLSEKELLAELPKKELPYWSKLIAGVDPGSQDEAWAKPTFDHSKWKTMKVPGHFDTVELPGFDGVVWFRKSIELSVEQAKTTATLHLGQIDDMDVTWVNGTRVGGYENPGHHYTVRNYPIPAGVLKPGKNVIAVRVMDHGAPGGIAGKPEQLFLQLNDERESLANLWHFAPGANLAALNKYSQIPPLLRPLSRPKSPVSAFPDGFSIDRDQMIVVLGGTNALESGRHGYLETLLVAAHPQHKVRVRNLAWQADTVYEQQRPRNFYAANKPDYGECDGRAKIEADIVVFWMGQTESLDGPERVDDFVAAYKQHLDQIAEYTKRIVLVTPIPFSNPLQLEIDIRKRNDSLAVYVNAIRKIGRDRNLPVVDLFGSLTLRVEHAANGLDSESQATVSRNGLHLSSAGHWFVARAFASQLAYSNRVASIKWCEANEGDKHGLEPASAESLRNAIRQKNDLWFRYWRPTNWAFLYGNRQSTPSSRDHTNPSRRWFPEELKNALPQLDKAEMRVHEAAQASNQSNARADESNAQADDVAQQARRLLAKKCFVCHGPDRNSEDAKETDLRLDLRDVALKYDAIVPGDAAASELMARITSQDPDSQMPPPGHGKPLSKTEVEILRRWIQSGANYESHWSFRKLRKTEVPQRTDGRSSDNPIDAFVLKRLGESNLQPSQQANKRTLIRRVYADAIGMPPPPEQFQRFIDDPAVGAYEQLVDRVLDSQHFGERWASHWLDVARFAESGGFELDGMRSNAYQFRDFVIKAFNDDLPYNKFIQWQIAGDEFEPDNIEALKATGFLGCGVRNAVITKNQVEKERYDELDDILSTTMTAMLGLSVGCARCHDHKYDPITSNDYYRLLSTFATTVRAEITVTQPSAEMDKALEIYERDHNRLVVKLKDYDENVLNSKSYTEPAIEHQPLQLSPWQSTGPLQTTGYLAGHNAVFPPEKTADSKPDPDATWRKRPDITDGVSHQISQSNSVFFYHRTITAESTTPAILSFGADDTVKAWLDGELIAERIIAAAVNADQALAHVTLPKGEHQLLVKIVNGPGIGGFYFNVKQQGVPKSIRDIVTTPVAQRSPQQAETLLNWSRQFDTKRQRLSGEIQRHLAKKPVPPQQTVFVSTEGRQGFRPAIYNVQGPEFYERTYVLSRGNVNSKLEPASQSFLKILMSHGDNQSHWIEQPPAESKSSYRRKSLANWMTDTQHGAGSLLARVIVNRVWQHHFGTGLVTTANDFGTQGALPTHPELLEWLANELVRNDWSLKHIHRLIMTSETFRQESAFSEQATRVDPENKLLWRFTPRRLEAEAIRDSMLSVSGQLDRTMFGSGTFDPRQKRRSIYFTVKRSLLNPMLSLYDAPETLTSAGRRNSTTTAPQALLLINSPYLRELSQAFAARISPQSDDDLSTLVTRAYRLALNREPSNNERLAATQFIERQQEDYERNNAANAKSAALADFAQAVFSVNEFIYVD